MHAHTRNQTHPDAHTRVHKHTHARTHTVTQTRARTHERVFVRAREPETSSFRTAAVQAPSVPRRSARPRSAKLATPVGSWAKETCPLERSTCPLVQPSPARTLARTCPRALTHQEVVVEEDLVGIAGESLTREHSVLPQLHRNRAAYPSRSRRSDIKHKAAKRCCFAASQSAAAPASSQLLALVCRRHGFPCEDPQVLLLDCRQAVL